MVELLSFKRPEMKFDGVEALKQQIHIDMEEGLSYHNLNKSKDEVK